MNELLPIDNYISIVTQALSRVGPEYYKVRTTYDETGIIRERIFCYELYHQIRLKMGDEQPLSIHAEIDKSGHIDFNVADQKNPDFVFHVPGEHKQNTLVVEVKGTLARGGICKDFKTLESFISSYGYQVGIFILYNNSLNDLLCNREFRQALPRLQSNTVADSIYVVTAQQHGEEVKSCLLSSIQIPQQTTRSIRGALGDVVKCISAKN